MDMQGNAKNCIQFNGLSSFSGGTLGASVSGSLPVEWLGFEVVQKGEDAFLNWSTASELQVEYFAIERSIDGNFFQEIDRQKATGTSLTPQTYQYRDEGVIFNQGQVFYYRIRQVDQDGSFDYSEVIELELTDHKNLDLWCNAMPVPVDEILTVRYDLFWEQAAHLELFNLVGTRFVYLPLVEKSGSKEVNVSQLPSGIYYLRLQGEDRQMVRKIEVRH